LAVGRTARTATRSQRRALAARDGGCIIPGCEVPAESCQAHHVTDWAAGGPSDINNLALLCWTHHRQVDLSMWTIQPAEPAEACQTHHVVEWADNGATDLPNLALVCWAHHRQVDLGMWTIVPTVTTDQVPRPEPAAPPGTPWPAHHGAPRTITRTPRTRWRL
jgi:hypothetical protein